jgi:hypothetical protein
MISVIGMPAPKKATKAPARTARKKPAGKKKVATHKSRKQTRKSAAKKRREEKTFMKQVDLPVLAMLTGLSTA